jgi:hypothetical protein
MAAIELLKGDKGDVLEGDGVNTGVSAVVFVPGSSRRADSGCGTDFIEG